MMSREAMQMAMEALEDSNDVARMEFGDEDYYSEAINALRQALETEQEPVAWRTFDGEGGYDYRSYEMNENYDKEWAEKNPNHAHWVEPLYTSPQKQWVGLTDEEIHDLIYLSQKIDASNSPWFDCLGFYRAIEAKLKEKNA
jgi:hypothetical protein